MTPRRPSRPTEIGLPADAITVEEGDTDTAPYGLGTYGSRSTPVAGAATAMAGRKIRAKAQMIAAYLLEVHDDDAALNRLPATASPDHVFADRPRHPKCRTQVCCQDFVKLLVFHIEQQASEVLT